MRFTFSWRFRDFRSQEQNIAFVSQSFSVKAEDVPAKLEMELIDLQCDEFIVPTQHVVVGDSWVPTSGSPLCWWWNYQSLMTGLKWAAIFSQA